MPSPEKRPTAANTAAPCTHTRVVRANGANAGATDAAVVPGGFKGRLVNGVASPFPDNAAYTVVHTTSEKCETCVQYPTAPSADSSPSSIRRGHSTPTPSPEPTEKGSEAPSMDEIVASNHVRRALTRTFTELSLETTPKPSNITATKPSKHVPMFASSKQLKHYQYEDLEKLLDREDDLHATAKGHIIAYPTGLGKTPLIIALVTSTVKKATGPTLVIVPSVGIMRQWESECKTFAPELKICTYYKSKKPDASNLSELDLVIATYRQILYQHGECMLDKTKDPQCPPCLTYPLFCVKWYRVVLDEAHGIRNHKTRSANACYAIVSQTKRAVCLTATPAQNSFMDFYSYFKFLSVSDYGLKNWADFRTKVEVLLRHVIWQPKELVNLPPLHTHVVDAVFAPEERSLYKFVQNMHHGRCAYVQLTRERQVCDHGSLVSLEVKPSDLLQVDGYDSDVGESAEEDPADLSSFMAALSINGLTEDRNDPWQPVSADDAQKWAFVLNRSYRSAKMRAAIKILKEIRMRPGNEKTIVFSHFIDSLDILDGFLSNEGFSRAYYTGEMNSTERDAALHSINCKPECTVILMSFKCGSDGLNIVSCNNIILLEPWWNPYVERQAIGRIHRIGQTRPSHVYRLLVPGTIEMQVRRKQLEKEASIDLLMGSFQDLKLEDMEEMLREARDDATEI
ncbi:hypothetical protein EVG20_g4109 [Dentipellis fragilis]|uniref:Helicase ATP-binding domain-containing protein n=1 Tax=Dentipellis fragilis TaxID=205917 RepID=A0A4Y9YYZ4_9AGAM|nr:hypothetical protein EVG20_g4109 [Dentipellis fragilis]